MIHLYEFQAEAADQIAERVAGYCLNPLEIGRSNDRRRVPFIQFLSSVTASGKTIILADATSSIAKLLPTKPIVLWLSKATVVVEQTFANLDSGGALHSLIDDFLVRPLADYDSQEVADEPNPFLFFATVGTFNQKDKEEGTRRVFRSAIDDASQSTWDALMFRPTADGTRRPLIVVYDEAHNLSDQQTDLLLELEPDALMLSTATQKIPHRVNEEIIEVLRSAGKLGDEYLVTNVKAKLVADSGLIKPTLELVGRQAPMEDVISEMLVEMAATTKDGVDYGLVGRPKAVYICKTNVVEGSDQRDSPKQPFNSRQAPPILIWRHLTEVLDVDPANVAVYADLKVDKGYPLPSEFVLFGGKDKDYAKFVEGEFQHIIFNQSLQEGWDDPLVYFAYIDKSMGSRVQAEQVVGRLLRQPGRKRFPAQRLNTAQICVRVESAGVFDDVVSSVQKKIMSEGLDLEFVKTPPGVKSRTEYGPKGLFEIPVAAIVTDAAEGHIKRCIDTMTDYRHDDGTNILGVGRVTRVQKVVGQPGNEALVWEESGNSAQILARWLFTREVRKIYPNALGLAVTSSADGTATKFDARMGLGSNAAHHIATVASQVADAFVDNVYLKLRKPNAYKVGNLLQHALNVVPFKNAVHSGYDGLNQQELDFANALDRSTLRWCRNPSQTGYGIPLVTPGRTETFYPDFVVWSSEDIFVIDTKGPHLHSDAMRKLVQIRSRGGGAPRVFVRFVTKGRVDENGATKDTTGYTSWSFKPNGARDFSYSETIDAALTSCLVPDR